MFICIHKPFGYVSVNKFNSLINKHEHAIPFLYVLVNRSFTHEQIIILNEQTQTKPRSIQLVTVLETIIGDFNYQLL